MHALAILFWMIAGAVILPPIAKLAQDWWSLHQVEKDLVNLKDIEREAARAQRWKTGGIYVAIVAAMLGLFACAVFL